MRTISCRNLRGCFAGCEWKLLLLSLLAAPGFPRLGEPDVPRLLIGNRQRYLAGRPWRSAIVKKESSGLARNFRQGIVVFGRGGRCIRTDAFRFHWRLPFIEVDPN